MAPTVAVAEKTSKARAIKSPGSPKSRAPDIRRRMLRWPNPVEYVNNMYGCHPGDDNTHYFDAVFADE